MSDLKQQLLKLNEQMAKAHDLYENAIFSKDRADEAYNQKYAELVLSDTVGNQKNQQAREALIQEYFATRDGYKELYRAKADADADYRIAVSFKMLLQEQSKNLRTIINLEAK